MEVVHETAAPDDNFGVYVHLPYCRHLCPYCDFNSYVSPEPPWLALEETLVAELRARAELFGAATVRSIYFGGGTPSLAPPGLVARVVSTVAELWPVRAGVEITLEANPGATDAAALPLFAKAGINRLSLGWQSTDDGLLRVLGRVHNAADSMRTYAAGRGSFDNISVDLIFAVPGQTLADLNRDLDALVALSPEHISLYGLTYHPGTPYHRWRDNGRIRQAPEELEVEMMDAIDARLGGAGYEHYEISNYAKAGLRAVHNSLYWMGGRYLGVGPGAHSFAHAQWQRGYRWEVVRNPDAYIAAWQDAGRRGLPRSGDASVSWVEELDGSTLLTERMMTGLRLREGVDLAALPWGDAAARVAGGVDEGLARGWLWREGSRIGPTVEGMRFNDGLAALFF